MNEILPVESTLVNQPELELCFESVYHGFSLQVDLRLPGSGVTAIFGHSGSGKTTLLRCVAGLIKAGVGRLIVDGQVWQDEQIFLPTHRRPLGVVFQEASLFDHLTARGNLNYAVKRADRSAPGVDFDQAVELLGLSQLLDRRPAQLSGGERQRVAIARALLVRPRLLLMDEPLASLDHARKQEILPYLERLRDQLGLPILYVSHSASEVARLADHLVVLDKGRVVASGPLTETLARLDLPLQMGDQTGVVLAGTVIERDQQWQLVRVEFAGGSFWLRDMGHAMGDRVRLQVHARDVSLALEQNQQTSILNILPVIVGEIAADESGGAALIRLHIADTVLLASLTLRSVNHLKLRPGCQVWAQIKSVALIE